MSRDIRLSQILAMKGSSVVTVAASLTLVEAARRMVDAHVGSLVVVDAGGSVEGILTERDLLKATARSPERLGTTCVADVMTRDVLVGLPADTIEQAMALMTERRLRHLPILDAGRLAGLVSIGDLVKVAAEENAFEVRLLRDFITGAYPG